MAVVWFPEVVNLYWWDISGYLQETFDAGLQAFEKEGIQTITTLKDQLVNARHAQTPAIERRYNDVIARYTAMSASCLTFVHSVIHPLADSLTSSLIPKVVMLWMQEPKSPVLWTQSCESFLFLCQE